MIMYRGFRYRIYPNELQEKLFIRTFGCERYIWNHFLALKNTQYAETKRSMSCFAMSGQITQMKNDPETAWLRDVSDWALKGSIINLDSAFTRFFRKQSKYPKFKKKSSIQSFYCGDQSRIIDDHHVRIPKAGKVKASIDRMPTGHIKYGTVSKNAANQYFISFLCEVDSPGFSKPKVDPEKTIGIDLGIKDFGVMSDGRRIANPKFLKESLDKLARAQKELSKKQKGGKNWEKQRIKVAKIYQHIKDQRNDFLHKLTYELTHENQVSTICIEDLNVAGMLKNHNLARSISDVSWSKFRDLLTYKCEWYGVNLVVISRWAPSSKMCPECGRLNDKLTLDQREWTCECGAHHDRDLNAAQNIRRFGLEQVHRIENIKSVT
jgi:putative transposase